MEWIKKYQEASFKGIPFKVQNHNLAGGRRKIIDVFPGRDSVNIQDLGKLNPGFNINAYVIGDDYFTDRNALIDVLNEGSPGVLIHPYFGRITVEVVTFEISETYDEGRLARFSISFVKEGTAKFAQEKIVPSLNVRNIRQRLFSTVNDTFLSVYSLARKPFSAIFAAQETLQVGITTINNAKKLYSNIPAFVHEVNKTLEMVETLITDGAELSTSLLRLITFGLIPESGDEEVSDREARSLFFSLRNTLDDAKLMQYSDKSEDPAGAIDDLIINYTIATLGGLITNINFSSVREARSYVNEIFWIIDILKADPFITEEKYNLFADFKVSLFSTLEEKLGDLARITTVNKSSPLPALVLSYELYGTIDKEQDIIDRNSVEHPGFLPSNTDLEVTIE